MALSLQSVLSAIGSVTRNSFNKTHHQPAPRPGVAPDGVSLSPEAEEISRLMNETERLAKDTQENQQLLLERASPPVGGVGSPFGPMQMKVLDAQAEVLVDGLVRAIENRSEEGESLGQVGRAQEEAGERWIMELDQRASQVISAQTQLALSRKLPQVNNPRTRAAAKRLKQVVRSKGRRGNLASGTLRALRDQRQVAGGTDQARGRSGSLAKQRL